MMSDKRSMPDFDHPDAKYRRKPDAMPPTPHYEPPREKRSVIKTVLFILLVFAAAASVILTATVFLPDLLDRDSAPAASQTAEETLAAAPETPDKADKPEEAPPQEGEAEALPEETEAAEEPAEEEPQEEPVNAELEALIAEADLLAAGYDYPAAIEHLRASGFDEADYAEKCAEYEAALGALTPYANMAGITHIFFHSLVADPARAFDGDATEAGYNLYMTTIEEFEAILESLYARGYVLVSPYDVAGPVTDESGITRFGYREIFLPEGKTPFMMSQDDVNYYGYMIGGTSGADEIPVFANEKNDGFASRIVIGEDGYPTCEYVDAEGNTLYGEYDLVPILERFIQEHPDFSYRGARATLGMTGYEGVFGYRTKPSYEGALGTEAYQAEVENAKAVAQCLRDHGWDLASHSYGHPAYGGISDDRVAADSDKWENTVQPIIGDTDILIYPHGSDIAGIENYDFYNAKYAALYEDGYRYFFNVDNCVSWHQMGEAYFRGNRRNLDGYRLYHHPDSMNDLIDARAILDDCRPLPVPEM